MHTKTQPVHPVHPVHPARSAHPTQQPKQPPAPHRSLPTLSRLTKTAIRLIVVGAVFVVVGIAAWNALRAEFDESFNRFSACPTTANERAA